MARRTIPPDPSIGERIKTRRELRRWSIRHAASRAGIAHTTWSRIEKGEMRTDRYMIADLAAALECSTADLVGQPHVPGDRALENAHARIARVWRTLVEVAPDEPPDRVPPPLAMLEARAELLDDRRRECDYAGAAQLLPDHLADLHAAAAGPDSVAALTMLVRATYVATFTLRNLGYVAECTLAAERCRQAAERLGEPVPLAVGEWVRAHAAGAAGAFGRTYTLSTRAADELAGHLNQPTAPEVLGMLHLTAALAVLPKRPDDARSHIAEAGRLAERTGETTSWTMCFGPTNVGIWRVGLEVDAHNPSAALHIAQDLRPALLKSRSRESSFYVDKARALADMRRDEDAVRALLLAERLAPQRVRSSVPARETSRYLLDRARREAGGSALRGLCERMALAV